MHSKDQHLLQALYHLQRGPMLGSAANHPDERALLHMLFLNAAPPGALKMLAPALHLLDRASGQFNAVIPADIALWSGELFKNLSGLRPCWVGSTSQGNGVSSFGSQLTLVGILGQTSDHALLSDSAAILDHGSHIFIWLGREVAAAMPELGGDGRWTRTILVCERYATRLASGRFPLPELITVTEV